MPLYEREMRAKFARRLGLGFYRRRVGAFHVERDTAGGEDMAVGRANFAREGYAEVTPK